MKGAGRSAVAGTGVRVGSVDHRCPSKRHTSRTDPLRRPPWDGGAARPLVESLDQPISYE